MIEWARPGQMVICVKPCGATFLAQHFCIDAGRVLTIDNVVVPASDFHVGLQFAEIPHTEGPLTITYDAVRFRPVQPTSIDVFQAMLRPVKDAVPT